MRFLVEHGRTPLPRARSSRQALLPLASLALVASCDVYEPPESYSPPPGPPPRFDPPPVPYEVAVARLPADLSEREKVEALLDVYCGNCHGSDVCDPEDACAGMNYIEDMDALVEGGEVIPGNPEESALIQSMVNGTMPPGARPEAPPELIDRAAAFIRSLCATDTGQCAADTGD